MVRTIWLCIAAAILAAATLAAPAEAGKGFKKNGFEQQAWDGHNSILVIPDEAELPQSRRITIGLDKSVMIELPVDVTDVLVSNPEVVDAVVQTPRRIYLLAKDVGEANAFFMGPGGKKVLLLEMSIMRDLAGLSDMLNKLIPGSDIKVATVGPNVALTGSVISPTDANRAAELASRFLKNKDSVVNMLSVANKEQVLLKIKVAEVQRDALKRIGVDIPRALLSSGNFSFTKVVANSFPVTSPSVPLGVAGSALLTGWNKGNQDVEALLRALERTGLVRTLAEPSLTAISGETAKFWPAANSRYLLPPPTSRSQLRSSSSACRRRSNPWFLIRAASASPFKQR
ncbi:MAG: pilus assembly protein N-terminal domain-containing protein [Hyphomicrobiaceae bacterium]